MFLKGGDFMPVNSSKKRRLSVPMSLEMYDRVCAEADKLGISPPTFVNMIVGNYFQTINMSQEAMLKAVQGSLLDMLKNVGLKEKDINEIQDDALNGTRHFLIGEKEKE